MKRWIWAAWMMLLCAGTMGQSAKEKKDVPSNDGKEPHTLSKKVKTETGNEFPADMRGETSFQGETSYQAGQAVVRPTPAPEKTAVPLQIKAGPLDKTVDGLRVRGYLARPAKVSPKVSPKGAVLMIHEWWGLNQTIKKQADQLADGGFNVLAIDLYGGQVAKDRREAASLMSRANPEKTLALLKAALTLLAQSEGKGEKPLKVGVIGWSFGAAYALKLAAADSRPAAVAVYYGELIRDPAQLAKISSSVLGFFAQDDAWVTPKKVQAFKQALIKTNPDVKIYIFETPPGFALEPKTQPEQAYAEKAAELTRGFMEQKLAP